MGDTKRPKVSTEQHQRVLELSDRIDEAPVGEARSFSEAVAIVADYVDEQLVSTGAAVEDVGEGDGSDDSEEPSINLGGGQDSGFRGF